MQSHGIRRHRCILSACGQSAVIKPNRSRQSSNRQSTSGDLPYDPEEWEQRLAAARVQREKVLQCRVGQERTSVLPSGEGRDDFLTPLLPEGPQDSHGEPSEGRLEGGRTADQGPLVLGGPDGTRIRARTRAGQRVRQDAGKTKPRSMSPKPVELGAQTAEAEHALGVPSDATASGGLTAPQAATPPRYSASRLRPALVGLCDRLCRRRVARKLRRHRPGHLRTGEPTGKACDFCQHFWAWRAIRDRTYYSAATGSKKCVDNARAGPAP